MNDQGLIESLVYLFFFVVMQEDKSKDSEGGEKDNEFFGKGKITSTDSASSTKASPPRNNGQAEQAWWQPAIFTFIKLSGWIVFPILIGTFLGNWLDSRYNTKPWLLLICIGVAFIISMIGLVKDTLREYKKVNSKNDKNDGTRRSK